MKGILLAGGVGSRLHPLTRVVSKQLLPVFDKPMVYYPLSTLLLAGIREILLISTPRDLPRFRDLLGDGSEVGASFEYAEQPAPNGIAAALHVGADFADRQPVALILGDNLFFGSGVAPAIRTAAAACDGASILAYRVPDPGRYGVIEMDALGRPIALEEKPAHPRSSYAVPGLYFLDGSAATRARELKPSARGELEITDLNRGYLREGRLAVTVLDENVKWFDAGTPEALLEASQFVKDGQADPLVLVGSIHENAYRAGMIDADALLRVASAFGNSEYGLRLTRAASHPAGAP